MPSHTTQPSLPLSFSSFKGSKVCVLCAFVLFLCVFVWATPSFASNYRQVVKMLEQNAASSHTPPAVSQSAPPKGVVIKPVQGIIARTAQQAQGLIQAKTAPQPTVQAGMPSSTVASAAPLPQGGMSARAVSFNASTGALQVNLIPQILPKADASINAFAVGFPATSTYTAQSAFVADTLDANLHSTADASGAALQGAAEVAAVAGVSAMTMQASLLSSKVVVQRALEHGTWFQTGMNTSSSTTGSGTLGQGFALWLAPLYAWNTAQGFQSNGFESGYESSFGGAILGADYTLNDTLRVGIAGQVGRGYTHSDGDFSPTDTALNYWGLSLYGGYYAQGFGLVTDANYTHMTSQIDQNHISSRGLGNTQADVSSSALSAGLTAQYSMRFGNVEIMPHVGVRYMASTVHAHDVINSGSTLFSVDEDTQHVWYIPAGVRVGAFIELEKGWYINPNLDAGVLWATGELESQTVAHMSGVPTNISLAMKNVDSLAFQGGLGLELGNADMQFSLQYTVLASEHQTGHMLFSSMRYAF